MVFFAFERILGKFEDMFYPIMRIKTTLLLIAVSALAVACVGSGNKTQESESNYPMDLIIGTYGHNIYRMGLNEDGTLTSKTPIKAENASFVIKGEDGVLYAASENDPQSGVYSFKATDGVYSAASLASDSDFGPCHLLKWQDYIFTADYGRGCISVFPVKDGEVQDKLSYIQYNGSGPHPERQTHSYIHQLRQIPQQICSNLGIKGEWLLASDLGDDTIHVLEIGGDSILTTYSDITLDDGTGPRHMEFNTKNNLLYCISELGGMAYVIAITNVDGKPSFEVIQSEKADIVGGGGSADIHLHPSGKFLYTSHRHQNDGVAVFSVKEDGTIEMTSYHNTGLHPRNFQITPDGKYMLVACRDSFDIEVYTIDQNTGSISEKPVSTEIFEGGDLPVCILFNN